MINVHLGYRAMVYFALYLSQHLSLWWTRQTCLLLEVRSSNGIRHSHKHQPHHSLFIGGDKAVGKAVLPALWISLQQPSRIAGNNPKSLREMSDSYEQRASLLSIPPNFKRLNICLFKERKFYFIFSLCGFVTTPPRAISHFSLHLKDLQEDAFNLHTPKQRKGLVWLNERLFWTPPKKQKIKTNSKK